MVTPIIAGTGTMGRRRGIEMRRHRHRRPSRWSLARAAVLLASSLLLSVGGRWRSAAATSSAFVGTTAPVRPASSPLPRGSLRSETDGDDYCRGALGGVGIGPIAAPSGALGNTFHARSLSSPLSSSRRSLVRLQGIPKMFRWLTDQYPNVNRRLSEGLTPDVVVDNFYLDMNGIIHPCTHDNSDQYVVLDETEMFKKIFSYVDRLYKLVRPRRLLYLAVDGVAPRAKMNQQRSRRFRSGKEAEELTASIVAKEGKLPEGSRFDSNCITPGTDFMLKLGLAMNKWIEFKQRTDPFWKNGAHVIFTGPDVPGEGEHKVMDYIRSFQASPEYRPNTQHVLYGLDADLIMLGLVTHEPRFMLLREKMSVVMAGRRGRGKKKDMLDYQRDDFELLELSALRDMFRIQFRKFADTGQQGERKLLKVKYDINRVIDDFVFMCMMVGNDFLPHCPHLDIDSGALSLMLSTYIDLLPTWGDYLTDKGKIHPLRFEEFVYNFAAYEEEHFQRRGYEENEPGFSLPTRSEEFRGKFYERPDSWSSESDHPDKAKVINKFHKKHPGDDEHESYRDFYYEKKLNMTTHEERRSLVRDYLEGLHWVLHYYHHGCPSWDWYFPHLYAPLATDLVNLSEFYEEHSEDGTEESTSTNAEDQASDDGFLTLPFKADTPIPSLAQLLSVLPPQSADLLPKPLAELMLDANSPLAEYYPRDFTSDPNGKRQPWEAVVNIPFIQSDLLLETVQSVLRDENEERALTNAEKKRNMPGDVKLYVPPNVGNFDAQGDGIDGGFKGGRRGRSGNYAGRRGSDSRKPAYRGKRTTAGGGRAGQVEKRGDRQERHGDRHH